jgi:soluble lytic murein transglycosylase-like protein
VSVPAIGASGATEPSDASAVAAARVTQLQQMIEAVASGFDPAQSATSTVSSSGSASDFSGMLATAASASGTSSTAGSDASAGSYSSIIDAAAAQYGLDPAILTGLVHQESGFDPNAVSSAGAEGLTQVMPENFAADGITNPFDPTQSIDGGAKQLSEDLQEFGGNYTDALAAYNAGSAAVTRYGGVPPYAQTQNYVQDVLAYAQQLGGQDQPAATSSTSLTGSTSGVTA